MGFPKCHFTIVRNSKVEYKIIHYKEVRERGTSLIFPCSCEYVHHNVKFMNCTSTQHFLIVGLSIILVKGLSDVGTLNESKCMTINHSPGFI